MKRFILFAVLIALACATAASGGTINGTNGPDNLIGGNQSDTINAFAGADYVDGKAYRDFIFCGDGDDTCYGHQGADDVSGQGDDDHIYAGCNGSCIAGAGNQLYGGPGGDTLGADNNFEDELQGGEGNDTCFGDQIDTFVNCELCVIDGSHFTC